MSKEAEMKHTRSGEGKICILCRLIFTNDVLLHFWRRSYFPKLKVLIFKLFSFYVIIFFLKIFKTSKHFELFRILLEHRKIIFRELQIFSWSLFLILYVSLKNLKTTCAKNWRLWVWEMKTFDQCTYIW